MNHLFNQHHHNVLDTVEVIDESVPSGYTTRTQPSVVHELRLSDFESIVLDVYDTARTAINTIEVRANIRSSMVYRASTYH
jgi:hypothetical protein